MTQLTQLEALQEQIRLKYEGLSKRLQQVARYILDNKNSVAFDTVATIAERANVPPSTLIRFASAFGYNGFNEMKRLFRQNLMEETASYTERAKLFRQLQSEETLPQQPENVLRMFAQAYSQSLRQLAEQTDPLLLEKAVDIFKHAKRLVYVALLVLRPISLMHCVI